MPDDSQLQKQDLLLKMLNMTTSDNDGVALVAIRKCNTLLQASGWTWEKLLAGKITIVEDPFKSSSAFDSILKRAAKTKPSPPPPPPPPPRDGDNPFDIYSSSGYTAQARAMGLSEISTRSNNYANPCYFCGDHVDSRSGYIFRPSDFNGSAPNKWSTVCVPCNKSAINSPIPLRPAPRTGKTAGLRGTKVNLDSL